MNFHEWLTAMPVDRVLTITLSYIKVIAWPAVVVTGVVMFRKPIKDLMGRLDSVAGPANTSATFAVDAARNLAGVGEVEAEAQALVEAASQRLNDADRSYRPDGGSVDPQAREVPQRETHNRAEGEPSVRPEDATVRATDGPGPREAAPNGADDESGEAAAAEGRPAVRNAAGEALWFWEDPESYEATLLKPLVSGWGRLENDARYIVNQLELGKDSVVLRRNPNDVLALFSYFEKQGLVSPEALETAVRTKRLRDELVHGRVDGRGGSAADVAQAVAGLRRSLRKVGMTLIGERMLRETGRADLTGRIDLPWV